MQNENTSFKKYWLCTIIFYITTIKYWYWLLFMWQSISQNLYFWVQNQYLTMINIVIVIMQNTKRDIFKQFNDSKYIF